MKFDSFNRLPLYTDDFCFYSIEEYKQEKPIVIHNPQDAFIISPVFLRSKKTLGEHILFVQEHQYRSAILIADNIEFVKSCPSLEYLKVFPSTEAVDFDYSPLYSLPNLTKLVCRTTDDDRKKIADIDYSQFQNLKTLYIHGSKGNLNLGKASSVQSLSVEGGYPSADSLVGAIPESLKSLSICQAPLRSLKGIEKAAELSWLSLSYNRILCDISQLSLAADSLKFLEIDTCGKISDFSSLSSLSCLEFLILKGNNNLKNLDFLKDMPKLKYFHTTMNIEDGNLHLCKNLPYAKVKDHRHYSLKNKDLPKNYLNPEIECPFEYIWGAKGDC